jgi:hypothetical protein
MKLILAGDGCNATLFDDANEAAAGDARHEPSHQLNRVDGGFTGLGGQGHPKNKEEN